MDSRPHQHRREVLPLDKTIGYQGIHYSQVDTHTLHDLIVRERASVQGRREMGREGVEVYHSEDGR